MFQGGCGQLLSAAEGLMKMKTEQIMKQATGKFLVTLTREEFDRRRF